MVDSDNCCCCCCDEELTDTEEDEEEVEENADAPGSETDVEEDWDRDTSLRGLSDALSGVAGAW